MRALRQCSGDTRAIPDTLFPRLCSGHLAFSCAKLPASLARLRRPTLLRTHSSPVAPWSAHLARQLSNAHIQNPALITQGAFRISPLESGLASQVCVSVCVTAVYECMIGAAASPKSGAQAGKVN